MPAGPRRKAAARTPSLASSTRIFLALTTLVIALAGYALLQTEGRRLAGGVLDEVARVRTEAAAHFLGRRIERDFGELSYVAALPDMRPGPYMQGQVDGLALGGGQRVSWAGIVDGAGRVTISSAPARLGGSVAAAAWFSGGRDGPFAETVTDPAATEILRFGLPVAHPSASAVVAAIELRRQRVADYLREAAEALHVDLFLLAPSGELLLSTAGADYPAAGLPSHGAAVVGRAGTFREQWPDGRQYIVSVAAPVVREGMPSLGWRMVGRIALENSLRADGLIPLATRLGGLVAVILLLTSLLFIAVAIAPFRRLADFSEWLLDGREGEYPPEERSTREARILSAAAARLQGRIEKDTPRD